MLIKQNVCLRKIYIKLLLVLCVGFSSHSLSVYGDDCTDVARNTSFNLANVDVSVGKCSSTHRKKTKLKYYLYIADFAESFIEIPTSNVTDPSTTISSRYLAGRAALYDDHNRKVGTCSASFLCIQNEDGIYTDISNYLSVDNGLIVTWFTPTTLINLELDSIIHSMVTECIVVASTKVGFNPFYGKTFNLVVSSDDQKIYFKFSKK